MLGNLLFGFKTVGFFYRLRDWLEAAVVEYFHGEIFVFGANISQHVFERVGVLTCRKGQLFVKEHLDAFFAFEAVTRNVDPEWNRSFLSGQYSLYESFSEVEPKLVDSRLLQVGHKRPTIFEETDHRLGSKGLQYRIERGTDVINLLIFERLENLWVPCRADYETKLYRNGLVRFHNN